MFKKNVVVFIGLSIIASGLNYIIYPLYARILAPSEYVNITVALSLFTQISAFLSSIIAITIGLSKSERPESANEKIELLQSFLFRLFFVLAAAFLLASPFIMRSIHTPTLFALPIASMMLFSIPILIVSGYLNGKGYMAKLGILTVISAGSQFVIGLSVSLLSHNGLATMTSMVGAQALTIVAIYKLFSKSQLPRIFEPLKQPLAATRGKNMGKLIKYTSLASLGVMAISLIQIADLFIVQDLVHADIKFYTDIYVISRIVFFAGMILIWPFLSEISLNHHHFNRRPFLKVIGYFAVITLVAVVALYLFGSQITHLLFGVQYKLIEVQQIGILSVLYKFFLLVITAVILYFIVLRSYTAIWFSAIASGIILIFSKLIDKNSTIFATLLDMNIIGGALAVIGVILLLSTPIRKAIVSPPTNSP